MIFYFEKVNLQFNINCGGLITINFFFLNFFFTDSDESQDSKGREGTIFITFCHLIPFMNIQTFIYSLTIERTALCF